MLGRTKLPSNQFNTNGEPDNPAEATPAKDAGGKWLRFKGKYTLALVILAVIAIAAITMYFWEGIKALQSYGYLGAFVISFLGSATVIIPVPALAVTFALGGVLKYPFLVGIAVGLAEPIGELTGYIAGRAGHRTFFESRYAALFIKVQGWMVRRGTLFLFLMSAVPNPVFDLAGVAAGAMRYPLYKYLLVCWAGKTVKGIGIAYAGYFGMRSLLSLFNIIYP